MSKRETIRAMQRFALSHARTAGTDLEPGNFYESGPPRMTNVALSVIKDPVSFDGMPVWLAVASKRDAFGRLVPWELWPERLRLDVAAELLAFLDGVGNAGRQRTIRTQTTLAVMRAVTGAEWETFGEDFHNADPLMLDGGPVAILHENWPGRLATRPCENPTRRREPGASSLVWDALDCGECAPCLDRAAVESERQRVARERQERQEQKEAFAAFLQTEEGQQWLQRQQAGEWGSVSTADADSGQP